MSYVEQPTYLLFSFNPTDPTLHLSPFLFYDLSHDPVTRPLLWSQEGKSRSLSQPAPHRENFYLHHLRPGTDPFYREVNVTLPSLSRLLLRLL